jgi:hypothetical protein
MNVEDLAPVGARGERPLWGCLCLFEPRLVTLSCWLWSALVGVGKGSRHRKDRRQRIVTP